MSSCSCLRDRLLPSGAGPSRSDAGRSPAGASAASGGARPAAARRIDAIHQERFLFAGFGASARSAGCRRAASAGFSRLNLDDQVVGGAIQAGLPWPRNGVPRPLSRRGWSWPGTATRAPECLADRRLVEFRAAPCRIQRPRFPTAEVSWARTSGPLPPRPDPLQLHQPAVADAFLMQIAHASCSPVRVMRVLHPADPPSWRNQGTSHDLPKLGGAGFEPLSAAQ